MGARLRRDLADNCWQPTFKRGKCFAPGLALPNHDHVPPKLLKFRASALVARNSACKLLNPELGPGLRDWASKSAIVAMPIAPVNQDNGPVLGQN